MLPKSLSFNLEPTFRCNLECEMCPRFSSEDPHLDMSMETFLRIHGAMDYAHTVDFTGWGEPMLHRRLGEMIRLAGRKGCVTSMTSNGTALTERNANSLIEAGLDRLTVSIDGFSPQTYDVIRKGAGIDRVTRNLQTLSRLIRQTGSALELGIAFTIQEINVSELDRLAPWVRSVGAKMVHLKHLNVISNGEDWQRSLLKYRLAPVQENGLSLEALEGGLSRLIQDLQADSIRVLTHSELPLSSEKKPRHCLATPLNSVYFSYEGRVAPCCHFGHHVSRFFEGTYYPPSSLFFGDIRRHGFIEIWNDPGFQQFRRGFVTENYPEACQTCYLLYGK